MVSVAADRKDSAIPVPPVRDIGCLPGGGVPDCAGRAQLEANRVYTFSHRRAKKLIPVKRSNPMIRTVVIFLGLMVLGLGCGPAQTTEQPAEEAQAQEQLEPSLYDRLGGVYAIASVVDDFIERL